MKWKRTIGLLLCLAMLMGILSGCGENTTGDKPIGDDSIPENAVTLDAELQRALDAGLLPEEWLSDLNATVTVAELNKQLTKIIEMRNPALVSEWESLAEYALLHEETAQRDDALVSIYEAAMLMGIENTRRSFVNEDWEAKSPAEDWWEGHTMDYDYFPNWGAVSADANSVWYAQTHVSLVNQETIFPPTEQWTMGLGLDVTREDAARALIRFMESDPSITYGESKYISVNDAGAYDRNIITDELLSANTTLPEVTQSKLPSEWQGAGISARKSYTDCYLHFEESNVRFLAENGFNLLRLFFGFSTLRYPDFPEDARMINEKELEELDQLLAWCLEYGIHLQIAMSFYLDENGNELEEMPRTEEEWALVKDYWEALAKRYAGIPSKYLSFDLCNEIEPHDEDIEDDKAGLTILVEAVRKADPGRVLLYSQASRASEEWAKVIASLGVAISSHPYFPEIFSSADWSYMEKNPHLDVSWPQPYFPIGNFMNRECPIEISGDVAGSTLRLHAYNSGMNPVIGVYGDGVLLKRIELQGQQVIDGEYYYFDTIYSVEIPDGTQNICIVMEDDYARLDTIHVEKNGIETVMVTSDAYGWLIYEDPLPLIVNGDGTYTNSEDLMCDEDIIYEKAVKPYREIAEQYGVGFMIGEFGVFGTKVYWDIEDVSAFYDTYLKMVEKYNLPWCCCELENSFPKHFLIMYGDESQWVGATVEEITYTFDDGSSETLRICKELVDTFTQYTK